MKDKHWIKESRLRRQDAKEKERYDKNYEEIFTGFRKPHWMLQLEQEQNPSGSLNNEKEKETNQTTTA